ncbi:GntR family transcriptional regulator [[Clostridium] symbiosum]|uniref:GntR family transcriptional regulator n=1 Tax=Clostridium symbiosum TaxID=1512 RepID=UPI001D08EA2D|nr:GntR family transcriptional regulator [[Clostridium] symbiosum]MCB6609493.1 GntR family transcriptional regulator [[Clostridium] symbiosum]MCB6929514.1 GntR family transcriptional regulator [[Clostridium] symbiosum]
MTDSDKLIYNLVYDYYEARILMGVCLYGETLPSIPKIGETFRMAPRTVRAALTRLEENGYIEVTARKLSRVIYQADMEQFRENAARYFVPRRAGIIDFCGAGLLLVEPVWVYAQGSLDKDTWEQLKKKLSEAWMTDLSVSIRLHLFAFDELQNKLFLNFYWELLRYIRFPYLSRREIHLERDRDLLSDGKENESEFMRVAFEDDFNASMTKLLTFCARAEEEYGLNEKEIIPFRWNVYWQRPQLCYTLVSRIIVKIMNGTYPIGSSLPPLSQMAEQLSVSYRTLRRTFNILGSLGIISSHRGKVAEVCFEIGAIDFGRAEVKEGLRLYRDSLQFMALTVRPVLLYTLQNAEKEQCDSLAAGFEDVSRQDACYQCFKLVSDFIVTNCSLATVRECYRVLAEFIVWGYPFVLKRAERPILQEEYLKVIGKAGNFLKNGELEGFADTWKGLLEQDLLKAGQMLDEHRCGR